VPPAKRFRTLTTCFAPGSDGPRWPSASGLRAALTDASLRGDIRELPAALHGVLRTPNALARWLAGEDLFAPARPPQG
jgi:hypothetical protein